MLGQEVDKIPACRKAVLSCIGDGRREFLEGLRQEAREKGRLLTSEQMTKLVEEDLGLSWEAEVITCENGQVDLWRGFLSPTEVRPPDEIPKREFVFCPACESWAEREPVKDPHDYYEYYHCGVCSQVLDLRVNPNLG